MDTVTYPDAGVMQELAAHWLVVPIDVTAAQDLARSFGVHAIPAAVAVRGDGHVLGRVDGFVPPATFLGRAAELRAAH
jgi:thioredoxin-like negative regulator of GroEL